MNMNEWCKLCKSSKSLVNWKYYNQTRKIQKSLVYNEDKNAVVIHHLRDTEEQRKYNDEHYELWGFEIDENGNDHFEYGKYVIFVTKEEHTEIHKLSEETRQKISEANKNKIVSKETREKMHEAWIGHEVSEETRKKISEANKGRFVGEKSPNYGKHLTEEQKSLISKNRKGKYTGNEHWLYGKQLPDDIKQRISKTHKENMTEERRKLISETTKAAMATDEVKIKMSESHKGIYPSDEAKEKMRIAHIERYKNNPVTDETKLKISNALKGRQFSDDHKYKLSKSTKSSWTVERRAAHGKAQKVKGEIFHRYVNDYKSSITWKEFNALCKEYRLLNNKTLDSFDEFIIFIQSKE